MSFGLTEQSTCETREGSPWDSPLKSRENGKFGLLRFADARHVAGTDGGGRKRVSDGAAFANFGKFCLRVGTYPRAENSDVWTKKEAAAAAVTPFPL